MMITDTELSKLTDKSSRDPEIVQLYREHDFLTAYSKHTDIRVQADPELAIGGDWEEYGNIQRDFLIAQGLRPEHRFLDIGCGTGRLARKIVPYLHTGKYVGLDVSEQAVSSAVRLLIDENCWVQKSPLFELLDIGDILLSLCYETDFDFTWAFSVFIHLPSEIVGEMMALVGRRLAPGGKFFFSYVPTDLPDNTRTGLKQFKHPFSFYEKVARALGYSLKEVEWPGRQRIVVMER